MKTIVLIFSFLFFTPPSFADRVADPDLEIRFNSAAPSMFGNILRALTCDAQEVEARNPNPGEKCQSSLALVEKVRSLPAEKRQKLAVLVADPKTKARLDCHAQCQMLSTPSEIADCLVTKCLGL